MYSVYCVYGYTSNVQNPYCIPLYWLVNMDPYMILIIAYYVTNPRKSYKTLVVHISIYIVYIHLYISCNPKKKQQITEVNWSLNRQPHKKNEVTDGGRFEKLSTELAGFLEINGHVPSTDSDPWDDCFFVINLGKYTWILFVKMNSLSTCVPTCVLVLYVFVLSDVSIKSSYYRHKVASHLYLQSYESFAKSNYITQYFSSKCSTPSQLLLCSSSSMENGHLEN